jgi:hypothetical protein
MKWNGVVLASLMLAVSGAAADEPKAVDANVARVAVYRAGQITLNGHEATINEVRQALAKLAESSGVVWYYREGADKEEPHPNAMLVISAIVEARLPVSMSTKPDFSDVLQPDGSTRPR